MKLSRGTAAFIASTALAGSLVSGALTFITPASASSPDPGIVTAFNDGFTTAKQDDCQQGFAAACTWLGASGVPVPASERAQMMASASRHFNPGQVATLGMIARPAAAHLTSASVPALPRWLHVQRAPRSVALQACGRWPKYGLGTSKRGQVVPAVEVSAPDTDGAVYCESGHVSTP